MTRIMHALPLLLLICLSAIQAAEGQPRLFFLDRGCSIISPEEGRLQIYAGSIVVFLSQGNGFTANAIVDSRKGTGLLDTTIASVTADLKNKKKAAIIHESKSPETYEVIADYIENGVALRDRMLLFQGPKELWCIEAIALADRAPADLKKLDVVFTSFALIPDASKNPPPPRW
jgi:hypothetical protein